MKTFSIALLIVSLAIASCTDTPKNNSTEGNSKSSNSLEHADWLVGIWKRTNEEEGKNTFEIWEKINEERYKGIGFTMQDKDTLSKEIILLHKTNAKWVLDVSLKGENKPTSFQVTNINNKEFTAVNEKNPFPKTIHYWKTGSILRAKISDDTLTIPFEFEKLR